MSVRVVTVAASLACGMAGAGGAAECRRRAPFRRRQDLRLQLLRRHPRRRPHPERPVGRGHHPDSRHRAGAVRAAPARHAEGQGQRGLRLRARHPVRAVLQSSTGPTRRASAARSPVCRFAYCDFTRRGTTRTPSVRTRCGASQPLESAAVRRRRATASAASVERRASEPASPSVGRCRAHGVTCDGRAALAVSRAREQQALVEPADAHQHQCPGR